MDHEKSAESVEEGKSSEHLDEPPHKKKKGKRGMNKNRPRQPRPDNTSKLCSYTANGEQCLRGDKCFYGHSVEEYLKNKLPDIGSDCVVFKRFGKCSYGINCRFSQCHVDENFKSIVDEDLRSKMEHLKTKDTLRKDLQVSLRKKQYLFPRTDRYLSTLKTKFKGATQKSVESKPIGSVTDEDVVRLRPNEKKKVRLFL